MAADLKALEPRLKTILYRCLEDLRATKAALYLSVEGNPYELVVSYGFQEGLRRQIKGNDPIVERLILRRSAFFINGQGADPRFHELLYHTDSDRILVVPLFAGGQLLGFLDMRDKAANAPFTASDIERAGGVIGELAAVFREQGLFAPQRPPAAGTATRPPSADPGPDNSPPPPDHEGLQSVIAYARQAVERDLRTATSRPRILTEAEIAPVETALQLILNLPGVVLAAFSAFGHLGNIQPMALRARMTDEAMKKFNAKLGSWVRKQGMPVDPEETRTRIVYPRGEDGPLIQAGALASILSAPVVVGSIHGLVLSVAFDHAPDREMQMALAAYLEQIRQTLEHSISHQAMRSLQQRVAEKLIEPDFQRYPELMDHSKRVSSLSEQLAQFAGLAPAEVEKVRLAGFVHDVGMRLLDYEKIYRKRELDEKEMELVRTHPVVGAALVAESPLGDEIASIVLRHHERVDGKGYPDGLAGEQIPLASRILHICEAFDAMTATQSYQPRIPESTALLQISRSAGAQFDAEMAQKFVEMLGGV